MPVDKHIRRLDADLARFEADLKDKLEGSDFESSGGRGVKSKSARFLLCGTPHRGKRARSPVEDVVASLVLLWRALWRKLRLPCLSEGRSQKEKRGSRGRGRRASEEDTPKKKKHKGG